MSFSIETYLAAGIRGLRAATGMSYDEIFEQVFQALNHIRQQAAESGEIEPFTEPYSPVLPDTPGPAPIDLTTAPGENAVNASNPVPAQPGNQITMPLLASATPQPTAPSSSSAPVAVAPAAQPGVFMNPYTGLPRKDSDEGANLWPCEYAGCACSYTRRYTVIEHMVAKHGMAAPPKRASRPRRAATANASSSEQAQQAGPSNAPQDNQAGPSGSATQNQQAGPSESASQEDQMDVDMEDEDIL
ncbi:hypothetical protein CORC01_12578 [Colletotrichum orchidophilum]|uniref:C2H2-type domain-containing protein n=1 Tax=Colletotrichum orchidophilum TaxID=1209926 RepID=A0A1G4ASQ5_9PEZI|nr:uncharacterized protein CORC01_12578 [Colletotrichum orchidophilum]OHE92123.1 hypothetical protein CORC01_12578 [Colletotrichum orchidophilum]